MDRTFWHRLEEIPGQQRFRDGFKGRKHKIYIIQMLSIGIDRWLKSLRLGCGTDSSIQRCDRSAMKNSQEKKNGWPVQCARMCELIWWYCALNVQSEIIFGAHLAKLCHAQHKCLDKVAQNRVRKAKQQKKGEEFWAVVHMQYEKGSQYQACRHQTTFSATKQSAG